MDWKALAARGWAIIKTLFGKKSSAPNKTVNTFGDVHAGRDVNIQVHTQQNNVAPPLAATAPAPALQSPPALSAEEELLAQMPELVRDMRSDLNEPDCQFVREFFVLPNQRVILNPGSKRRFVYFEDSYTNLRGQLDVLEGHGLLTDITPPRNNAPIYRMTEKLVKLLTR